MGEPAASWRRLVARVFPGISGDLKPWGRRNVVAGITVLVYLVPQVMAYSTVAGVAPIVGLWACLPALVIYAILGTSRLLSLGPESSVALMSAAVVAPLVVTNPDRYPALVAALALGVGVVCVLASALRLGFIADLFSRPVLVGYMTGIALLMIEGQLDRLFGIQVEYESVVGHIWQVMGSLGEADIANVVLSACILALLFGLRWLWPKLPGPLIAMVVAAGFAAVLAALGLPVPLVGDVPAGLPMPSLPNLTGPEWQLIVVGALGVSLVAFTDVALTGRAFREPDDPPIQAGVELRALGVANLGAGVLSGMPVSSSGSRTSVARSSRATSQGYSLVVAVGLIAVLLFAGPVLAVLPQAGLAALVVHAAVLLIDRTEYLRLWQFRRTEFLLATLTVVGVLVAGVLYGVLIAISVSVLELLTRVARPHSSALGLVPEVPGMHDVDDFPDAVEVPGLLVFRYDSPLFFANADNFLHSAMKLAKEREPSLDWFALNCEAIIEVDATATQTLQRLQQDLKLQSVRLVLVRAKRELIEDLEPTGLIKDIGTDHIYPTLPTLVSAFKARPLTDGEGPRDQDESESR
ncbi:MAG: STAS domain-containing protein [Actinomycetia bacterium]|nr:STAS domain-containing protein [Actinomycetes bacterium]